MRTHQEIDRRSLALARAIAAKIDGDPQREGLRHPRETCARWFAGNPTPAIAERLGILDGDWDEIR